VDFHLKRLGDVEMSFLDSMLGGALSDSTAGGGSGDNTRRLLMMGVLAMIAHQGGNAQQTGGGGPLSALAGMLGGGAGSGAAAGGLVGMLGGLLGGTQTTQSAGAAAVPGDLGGLNGLSQLLQGAGLGDAVQSWIGTGSNQPISADQISQALGPDGHLEQLANAAGVSQEDAAQHLSSLLPAIVNHLTPNGTLPQGQLDLAGLAEQFLGGRGN
jgi:uncharacterized protein YidB (DUF937 family)